MKHFRIREAIPLLLLLVPLLLSSACSSDDDDSDSSPTPAETTAPGDDDTGPTVPPGDDDATGTTPPEETTAPGDDDTGDGFTSPYPKDLYVRGTLNGWTGDTTALADYKLHPIGENLLAATVLVPFGALEFKIADNAWSRGTNFGNPPGTNDVITLDVPKVLGDNGFNLKLAVGTAGMYTFTLDATELLTPSVTVHFEYAVEVPVEPDLTKARARWLDRNTIVWNTPDAASYFLYHAPEGGIQYADGELTGGTAVPLTAAGTLATSDPLYSSYPYLKGQDKFDASAVVDLERLLTGQLVIAARCENGKVCDATSIQTAGVLDDLFTYPGNDLGVTFGTDGSPTLKLWAPTAKSVEVSIYETSSAAEPLETRMMTRGEKGVWSVTGAPGWNGKFYVYEVSVYVPATGKIEHNRVTDPYSVSLSMNSLRSQIIDLEDDALKPEGWDSLTKPALEAFEDITLYELHVRDFSASDATCSEANRGRFLAFTETESDGMRHLSALADAGLTHLHLMPAFDITSVNEDVTQQLTPAVPIDEAPDSEAQQAAVSAVKDQDAFNWGYDPYHFMVPEGSYASDPDGPARILEFRQMVKSLNRTGLRVVMDVVFNHTSAAGQGEKSVLDKIVPGYYYRLDDNGNIQNSSCCPDTATEHRMMEKLMIDAVRLWTTRYKVDGFRFDLMGHHTLENMSNLRGMLDGLTLAEDGVDGSKVYLYGEGWKFGSLDAILPEQTASQLNSYGMGIGTFNDRIRDSARGGSPFAELYEQGFVTGMYYDDNFLAMEGLGEEEYLEAQRATLLNLTDNIRIGMAGNLSYFEFMGAEGELVTGADIIYRGSAGAGYTADPQEVINYVSVHDNQTLWDNIQAKAPFEVSGRTPETATLEARVRMQNLGMSVVVLGQGVPFFLAGDDMLRSKSGDKDSYNSGDWFNKLDFTYESDNWGVGLPVADKNQSDWDFWGERLAEVSIRPDEEAILSSVSHFRELLRIRRSSLLFRLRSGDDIVNRVRFLNAEAGTEQIPGVIVMSISDKVGTDLDPGLEMIVTLINATTEAVTFEHEALRVPLELHPEQQASADPVVAASSCGTGDGRITVPARTAMVCLER